MNGGRRDSMRIRHLSSAFLGILAALGLSSCQQPYHEPEEHYVFIASNINLPYWQEAQAGLVDAAKQMGVKADFEGPDKFDPKEELDAFQKAVASKPSGIMVSVSRLNYFTMPSMRPSSWVFQSSPSIQTRRKPNACFLSGPTVSVR